MFFVFQSVGTGYMLGIVSRLVLWSFRSKRTQISCYKRLNWRFWLRSKAKQFCGAMVALDQNHLAALLCPTSVLHKSFSAATKTTDQRLENIGPEIIEKFFVSQETTKSFCTLFWKLSLKPTKAYRQGIEKAKKNVKRFVHCVPRQVTDASVASPPFLDQLAANMVP